MTKSVSQIIHEAMGGTEWYPEETKTAYSCENCKVKIMRDVYPSNPNYLIHGPDWTKMIQWAVKQDFWQEFRMISIMDSTCHSPVPQSFADASLAGWVDGCKVMEKLFTDPPALATKLAEFIKDKEAGR